MGNGTEPDTIDIHPHRVGAARIGIEGGYAG
jgi:hypothetical protein